MGNQSSSESLANTESISNQINSISNENCITACDSDISNSNIILENGDIQGDINISAVCNILGSSCVLKAALSDSVQNTQKNTQLAESMQSASPLTWFSNQHAGVTENNNQDIANRVSNIINSTCQNTSSNKVEGINVEIIGEKVGGNVNIGSKGNITKSQCIINNTSRVTLSNDQTNSQTARIFQGSPLLFGFLALIIIIIIVMIGIVIFGVGGIGAYEGMKGSGSSMGPPMEPMGPPMGEPMGTPMEPMGPPQRISSTRIPLGNISLSYNPQSATSQSATPVTMPVSQNVMETAF